MNTPLLCNADREWACWFAQRLAAGMSRRTGGQERQYSAEHMEKWVKGGTGKHGLDPSDLFILRFSRDSNLIGQEPTQPTK